MEEAILVDISTTVPLQNITLTSNKFLIGRGLHNSRIIEDINISRTHCILEQNNGEWCISDKSSNGTWLNGHLLDKTRSHTLTNGDVIGLSETIKFVFKKSPNTHETDTNPKALSDNEILDIAETVIAEVEALDTDFYMNRFDDSVFDSTNKGPETSNPSRLLSDKNKQTSNLVHVKAGLNGIHTFGPITIHRPSVVNIVQKPVVVPEKVHPPNESNCVQQSSELIRIKPLADLLKPSSSSTVIEKPTKIHTSQEPTSSKDASNMQNKANLDFVEDELQCSICTEMFVKAVTLPCSHTFCKFCITQWQKNQTVCPICRSKITMQFPTLVVDNFIDKILESATEDVKQHRRELIAEREKLSAPPPSTSNSAPSPSEPHSRRRSGDEPIEISSSEDNSDSDEYEDDDNMDFSGTDWDNDDDDWFIDYNGLPGCYFGGYGHCYACGQRGHWANGCPNRRKR